MEGIRKSEKGKGNIPLGAKEKKQPERKQHRRREEERGKGGRGERGGVKLTGRVTRHEFAWGEKFKVGVY